MSGFFISNYVSFFWSIFLSNYNFWYVTPFISHSRIWCKNVFDFLLNSWTISAFLFIMYYLNYLKSPAISLAISSAMWFMWSHRWFRVDYIGDFRSFRIGLSRYKKLFNDGKPNVLMVSNFFNAKDILVSLSYSTRSILDYSAKKFLNYDWICTDTFWIRYDDENADGMLRIAFL